MGSSIISSREFQLVFADWRVFMNEEDRLSLDVLYYQEKIIEAITNCKDLRVLQYLEKFNRLWIEKHTKEKE